MKPSFVKKLPRDDESHHLWEIVAAQLLIAAVTASWFFVEGHFGYDRDWVERYLIGTFFWLNLLAIFLVPLVAACLLFVAAIQRSWQPVIYASVEMALWLAHLQASFPWLARM